MTSVGDLLGDVLQAWDREQRVASLFLSQAEPDIQALQKQIYTGCEFLFSIWPKRR